MQTNLRPHFPTKIIYDIIERMKRSIWFWLYFFIAIVLAVYLSTRIILTYTGRGPNANIRTISLSADTPNKDLTQIATAIAIAPNTHSYQARLDEINQRIMATPGVRNSSVRRMPNGNLSVRVQLHQAVAQWTDGEMYYPLSADGTIVNRPSDTRTAGTVVFRGELPPDVSEITNTAMGIIDNLDYIEWIENRRWNVHTTGGITIMLPEKNPETAMASLIVLDKNHQILSKDLEIIDMRDDARILVK